MTEIKQKDNDKRGVFEIFEDGKFAGEMTYTWIQDKAFIIDHTGVDPAFGGKGYGKELVMKAVEFARENNLKILPLCPFAKKVFDKDESLASLRF